MNRLTNSNLVVPFGPETPLIETLLAEVAIRIELPPSQHQLAVERYEAVRNHVERNGSPLEGRVTLFYPQGSMAIGATIRSWRRSDGYDIDIVAEVEMPPGMSPARVFELLFEAINGEPGSRYHGKVERQTRCVTVHYADGMHLDVTPACLVDAWEPRRSDIFHANPEKPPSEHRRVPMNAFAFVEWFKENTPIAYSFADTYGQKARKHDSLLQQRAAEALPVPKHPVISGNKSASVVALQLLKRYRNMRYARRQGRLPPSVMLSKLAAEVEVSGRSLIEALNAISAHVLATLEAAERAGKLVDVCNPCCADDRFTDRWPEDRAAQQLFITDFRLFRQHLAELMSGEHDLEGLRNLFAQMFGEGPSRSAIEDHYEEIAAGIRSNHRSFAPSGAVVLGAPAIIKPTSVVAKPHTFYGSRWRGR